MFVEAGEKIVVAFLLDVLECCSLFPRNNKNYHRSREYNSCAASGNVKSLQENNWPGSTSFIDYPDVLFPLPFGTEVMTRVLCLGQCQDQ